MSVQKVLYASLVTLLAATCPAFAEVDIFLCSPSIPGESADVDFNDCTELLAVGERIELLSEDADKVTKSIDILPVEIRKEFDLGSPALRRLALTEEVFDGVISFRARGESGFVFLEMDLENAQVVNIRMDENGDVPVETVTVLPERIGWTYTKQTATGTPGATTEFFYDLNSGVAF